MIYSEIDFQKRKNIYVCGMRKHDVHELGCAPQRNSTAPQAMTLFFLLIAMLSFINVLASGGMSGQPSPVHFVHSPSSTCVLLILLCNIRKTLVKHSPFINCYFFYSLYDTGCKKEPFKSTN